MMRWYTMTSFCMFVVVFACSMTPSLQRRLKMRIEEELEEGMNYGKHNIVVRAAPDESKTSNNQPIDAEEYIQDDHKYYRSLYYRNGKNWWYDLYGDTEKEPTFHKILSKNIRFSDTIKISFKFPYYGHIIQNVTITNKGYLFLGERLHKFNASAQYAAPLMADFGDNRTRIHYLDTGSRFTVEWAKMMLREDGVTDFSFQCTIFKNGTLVFAYKDVPIPVSKLSNANFPVRVGLSDTYRRDEIVRRPTKINGKLYSGIHYIYYNLYHKVKLPKEKVVDNSAFVIIPETNCIMLDTCEKCVKTKTAFSCSWCPKLKRCSDGIDRYRQQWLQAGCDDNSVDKCKSNEISAGEIVLVVLIPVAVVISIVAFILYAYLHPESKSGMCLIQYGNPAKWCRNRRDDGTSDNQPSTSGGGKISFKTMDFESQA